MLSLRLKLEKLKWSRSVSLVSNCLAFRGGLE